jgi:hypothetical protein
MNDNNNLLNGINVMPYDTDTADVVDNSGNLITSSISIKGQGTTSTLHTNYGNISTSTGWYTPYYDSDIKISDSFSDIIKKEFQELKNNEILNDIEKFCNDFCFFGREKLCDGEIKCDCPLWNRLKCEKRV